MGIRWLDNEQQCVDPFEKNANTPQRTASWLYWSNFVGEHRATVPFDWDQTDRIVRAFDVLGDPACQTDDGGDRRTGALSYSLCSASPVLGDTAFLKYPGKFNKFGKEVIADQRHNIFNYLGIQNGAIRVKFTFKDHVGNVGSTEANFDGDFRDSNPGVEARGRLQSAWVTQPVQVDSQGPTLTKVGLVGPYNTGASPTQAVEESLLKGVNDVSDVNLIAAIGDVITLSYELSKEASRPTSVAINGEKIDDDAVFRPVDADPTMAACVSRTCVSEYSGREFTTFNVSLLSTKWAVDKTVKLTDYPTGMRAFVAHNNCQARRHGGGALWNPLWAEYCLFGLPPVTWYLAGVQDRARLGLYESTEKSAVPSVCGEAGAGLACEPGEDATLVSCKGTELQTQPLVSDSLTLASPVALSRSRYADEPKPNYTVPSIVDMCVQSSNKYPHLAKVGDRIRVSVWADQPIYKPNMTIAGIVVPLSDITANSTNSFTVDHINGETCVKSILAQKNYKKIDLEGDDPRQACYGDIDACMALAVETCEDMETDATGTSVKCMGFHIRRVLKEETIDGKRRSLLSARAQCDRAMTARHLLQVEWVESESSSSPDLCNDFSLITYFRRKSEQETTVFDSCTGMFVERTYANVHWTGTVTIDDPTSQVDGLVQISVNYRNVNDTWGVLVTEDDIDELGAACMPSDCPRCQVEEEVSCPVTGVWLDTTPPVITSIDTRMRWLCDSRFNGGTEYLEIHRRKISAADYILDPGFDDKYVVDGIGSGSDVYYTTPTINISDSYQMLFHQLSSMRSLDYPDLVYTGQEHLYINVSVSEPVQNLEESVSFANRPIASFSDSRAGDRGYWAYGTHEWTRNNQYGPSPDGEDPSVWGGFVFFIDTLIKEYYNFTTSTVIGGENGDIDIPFDVAGLTDLAGNVAVTRTQSEVEIFDRKRFSFDVEGPMLAERIDGKPNSECSMAPTGRDTCSDHCFYWQNMDDHTSWLGVIEDDVRAPPIDIGQGQSTKSVCYTDNKLGKGKAIPGDTMTCEFTFTEEVIIESFSPHGAYHFYGTDCDETECRYFVGSPLSDVNIVGYGGKVPEKGDYTFTSGNGQTYSHNGTSFDEMTETHDTFSKSWTVTMTVPEDLPEGRLRFAVTVFDKSCKTLLHGNGLIVSDNEDDYDNVVYFKKTPPAVTKLCDLKTDHTKKVRIAKPDTVVSFTWSTSNDLMEDWEKHSKTRNLRDISLSRGDNIVDDYSSSAGLTSTADASPFAGNYTDMLPEVNAYLCDVKLSAELVSTRRVGNSSDPPEVIDPEDSRGWHYETIVNLTASETDSTSDGLGKSCVGFGALMFEFKFMDIFGVDNREKVDKRAHQTQDCAGSEEKLFESVFFSNVPPALDAVNDAYDAMPAKVCSNSSFAVDLPPYTFFYDMDREIIVPQWEEREFLHDETYSPEICQPVGVREAGPGDYVSVFFDFNEFETLPVKITAATIGGNSVPRAGFGNYNTYNPLGQPQCQNALNIAGVPSFNNNTGSPLSYGKRKYASAYNQTYWGGDSCDNADLRNVDEVRPGEPVCTALVNAYGPGPCDKTCSSPKSPCSDYYREWSITTTLGLPLSSGPIPWTVDVEDYLGQTARFNGETTTVIYVEPSEESCAGRCGLLSESGACSCAAGCRDLGNCCADAPTCCKDYVGSSLEAQDQDGGCLIPDDRPPQAVVKTWSDNKFWGPSVAIAGDRVFTALFGDEPIAPPQFSFGLADYLVKIPASAVRAFSPAASKQMALSWGKVLRAEEERMKAYDPDAEEAETRAHTKAFKLAVSSYSQIQKSLINENCKLFSGRYNNPLFERCTLSNSQYRTKRFTGMNSTLPVSSFREVPRTDFYWAAFKTPSQYTDNGLMPFEVQFQEESQNQLFARYGTPGLPINDESVLDSYVEIVPEASLLEGAYFDTRAVTPPLHDLGVTMYSSRTTELPMPSVVYVNPPVIETCEWSQETKNCCRLPDDCGYECSDGKVGFGDVVYLQHITNQGVFYPSVQISGVTLTGTPLSQDKLTFSNYSSPAPPIEWIIRTDPLLTGNGPAWKGGLVVGAGSLPLSYEWVHGLIINEKHSHKSGPVPFTASMRDEVGNSVAFGASKPGEVSELDCSTDRPVLDLDPPSFIQCEANNPTGDGFDLTFALCEPGWVNYTVVECGLAGGFSGTGSNSNDEGTSGGDGIGNSNVTGFVEIPLGSSIGDVKAIVTTLRYLKDSTQYCVWVDACDIHSNCIRRELAITGDGDGRAPDLNEETLDETAPSFNVQPACYPEDRYGFSMDIGFATNEPGKVYWMITNSCVDVGEFNNLGNILGSDIKAGVLPSGYPGDIIGSGVVIIPNATTPDPLRKLLQQTESTTLGRGNLTIDGLEDDTSYCVFFALEDDASPPNLNKGSLYIPCTTRMVRPPNITFASVTSSHRDYITNATNTTRDQLYIKINSDTPITTPYVGLKLPDGRCWSPDGKFGFNFPRWMKDMFERDNPDDDTPKRRRNLLDVEGVKCDAVDANNKTGAIVLPYYFDDGPVSQILTSNREDPTTPEVCTANSLRPGCKLAKFQLPGTTVMPVQGSNNTEFLAVFSNWVGLINEGQVEFCIYNYMDFGPFGEEQCCYDYSGNRGGNAGELVTTIRGDGATNTFVDKTPPELDASLYTNNTVSILRAGIGNLLTMVLTADEPIFQPVVVVEGTTVPLDKGVEGVRGADGTNNPQHQWIVTFIIRDTPAAINRRLTWAVGALDDLYNGPTLLADCDMDSSEWVYIDTVRPSLAYLYIQSDNGCNGDVAKPGDTVALTMVATEPIFTPVVKIAGIAVEPYDISNGFVSHERRPENNIDLAPGMRWTANITLYEGMMEEGFVRFEVSNITDSFAANKAVAAFRRAVGPVSIVRRWSRVYFDSSVPKISYSVTTNNPSGDKIAHPGDTVTVKVRASEYITNPVVTVGDMIAQYPGGNFDFYMPGTYPKLLFPPWLWYAYTQIARYRPDLDLDVGLDVLIDEGTVSKRKLLQVVQLWDGASGQTGYYYSLATKQSKISVIDPYDLPSFARFFHPAARMGRMTYESGETRDYSLPGPTAIARQCNDYPFNNTRLGLEFGIPEMGLSSFMPMSRYFEYNFTLSKGDSEDGILDITAGYFRDRAGNWGENHTGCGNCEDFFPHCDEVASKTERFQDRLTFDDDLLVRIQDASEFYGGKDAWGLGFVSAYCNGAQVVDGFVSAGECEAAPQYSAYDPVAAQLEFFNMGVFDPTQDAPLEVAWSFRTPYGFSIEFKDGPVAVAEQYYEFKADLFDNEISIIETDATAYLYASFFELNSWLDFYNDRLGVCTQYNEHSCMGTCASVGAGFEAFCDEGPIQYEEERANLTSCTVVRDQNDARVIHPKRVKRNERVVVTLEFTEPVTAPNFAVATNFIEGAVMTPAAASFTLPDFMSSFEYCDAATNSADNLNAIANNKKPIVANGICDPSLNVYPCYDGGDCCEHTCIVSECNSPDSVKSREDGATCLDISYNAFSGERENSVWDDVFYNWQVSKEYSTRWQYSYKLQDIAPADVNAIYEEGGPGQLILQFYCESLVNFGKNTGGYGTWCDDLLESGFITDEQTRDDIQAAPTRRLLQESEYCPRRYGALRTSRCQCVSGIDERIGTVSRNFGGPGGFDSGSGRGTEESMININPRDSWTADRLCKVNDMYGDLYVNDAACDCDPNNDGDSCYLYPDRPECASINEEAGFEVYDPAVPLDRALDLRTFARYELPKATHNSSNVDPFKWMAAEQARLALSALLGRVVTSTNPPDGPLRVNVIDASYQDIYGNLGYYGSCPDDPVIVDNTLPEINNLMMYSNNANDDKWCKVGDVVTVVFNTSELVFLPSVKIAGVYCDNVAPYDVDVGGPIAYQDEGYTLWTCSRTITVADNNTITQAGTLEVSIDIEDLWGNRNRGYGQDAVVPFGPSDPTPVRIDKYVPYIIYLDDLSSNFPSDYARDGSVIALTVVASVPIKEPTATIAGQSVDIIWYAGNAQSFNGSNAYGYRGSAFDDGTVPVRRHLSQLTNQDTRDPRYGTNSSDIWYGYRTFRKGEQADGLLQFTVQIQSSKGAGIEGCCVYTDTVNNDNVIPSSKYRFRSPTFSESEPDPLDKLRAAILPPWAVEGKPPRVIVDTTPPTAVELRVETSSVVDNKKASVGHTVSMYLTASEDLRDSDYSTTFANASTYIEGWSPGLRAEIGPFYLLPWCDYEPQLGRTALPHESGPIRRLLQFDNCSPTGWVDGGERVWKMNHTVTPFEMEPIKVETVIPIAIYMIDIAGNIADVVTSPVGSDPSPALYDPFLVEVVECNMWSSNPLSNGYALPGDELYQRVTFSKPVTSPSLYLHPELGDVGIIINAVGSNGWEGLGEGFSRDDGAALHYEWVLTWNVPLIPEPFPEGYLLHDVWDFEDEVGLTARKNCTGAMPYPPVSPYPEQVYYDRFCPNFTSIAMMSDSGVDGGNRAGNNDGIIMILEANELLREVPTVYICGREERHLAYVELLGDTIYRARATTTKDCSVDANSRINFWVPRTYFDRAGVPACDEYSEVVNTDTPRVLLDLIPPVFTNNRPEEASAHATCIDWNIQIDEQGETCFIAVPKGADPPSVAEVFACQGGGGTVPQSCDCVDHATGNSDVFASACGLFSATVYDFWFAAVDAVGNVQTSPTLRTGTTSGIEFNKYKLTVSEDGATDSFECRLMAQPTADVEALFVVNVSYANQIDFGTNSVRTLTLRRTFTPQNWDQWQTVVVGAVDDLLVEGTHVVPFMTHLRSLDLDYNVTTARSVPVTVLDNDAPQVIIETTAIVTDERTERTICVRLGTGPPGSDTVVVTLRSEDLGEMVILPESEGGGFIAIEFNSTNFQECVYIRVVPVGDDIARPDRVVDINVEVASTIDAYDNYPVPAIPVTILDLNQAGIEADKTLVTISLSESQNFRVRLMSEPVTEVVVRPERFPGQPSTFGGHRFDPPFRVYDYTNWDEWQEFTAIGVDDGVDSGDVRIPINFNAVGQSANARDPHYNDMQCPNWFDLGYDGSYPPAWCYPFSLMVIEGNTAGFTYTNDEGDSVEDTLEPLLLPEGTCLSYWVRPSTVPAGAVTLTPTYDKPGSRDFNLAFTPTGLGFSATETTAQLVTVCAAEDALEQGDRTYDLPHCAASAEDPLYDAVGCNGGIVRITVIDNDAGRIIITKNQTFLQETKLGRNTGTFDFHAYLSAEPEHPVYCEFRDETFGPPPENDNGLNVSFVVGKTHTFTKDNYNIPQLVTIFANQDGTDEGIHLAPLCIHCDTIDVMYIDSIEPCVAVVIDDSSFRADDEPTEAGGRAITDGGNGADIPPNVFPNIDCGNDEIPDWTVTVIENFKPEVPNTISDIVFDPVTHYINVSALRCNVPQDKLPGEVDLIINTNTTEVTPLFVLYNREARDMDTTWDVIDVVTGFGQISFKTDKVGYYILVDIFPIVQLVHDPLEVVTWVEKNEPEPFLPNVRIEPVPGLRFYTAALDKIEITFNDAAWVRNEDVPRNGLGPQYPPLPTQPYNCREAVGGCPLNNTGLRAVWNAQTLMLSIEPQAPAASRRSLLQASTDGTTLSDYQEALRQLTFVNYQYNVTNQQRPFSIVFFEPYLSNEVLTNWPINVIPVNDPPIVTNSPSVAVYTEKQKGFLIDPLVTVFDYDNRKLVGASLELSPNRVTEDELLWEVAWVVEAAVAQGLPVPEGLENITAVIDVNPASDNAIIFSGVAPVLTYQAIFRAVRFRNMGPRLSGGLKREFIYRASDADSTSLPSIKKITVIPVNDPPQALRQVIVHTPEEKPQTSTLAATDPEDDVLTYSLVCPPSKGDFRFIDIHTGEYEYTPYPGQSGVDKLVFVTNDGEYDSKLSSVEIRIGAVNNPPVGYNVTINVWESIPERGELVGTDPDGDDDVFRYHVMVEPEDPESLALDNEIAGLFRAGGPGFTYLVTPDSPVVARVDELITDLIKLGPVDWNAIARTSAHPGYHADEFQYKVVDKSGYPSTLANVFVNVRLKRENNTAPQAYDIDLVVLEDTPFEGIFPTTDLESPRHLTHIRMPQPVPIRGSVLVDEDFSKKFTYMGDRNAYGSDTWSYRATDAHLAHSNIAFVNVTILPVNDAALALCTGSSEMYGPVIQALVEHHKDDVNVSIPKMLDELDVLSEGPFFATKVFERTLRDILEVGKDEGKHGWINLNISCGGITGSSRAPVITNMNDPVAVALLAYDVDEFDGLKYRITAMPERGRLFEMKADNSRGEEIVDTDQIFDRPYVIFVPSNNARGNFMFEWAGVDSDGLTGPGVRVLINAKCAPGFKRAGLTCEACPAGTINQAGQYDQSICRQCSPGMYQSLLGQTQCLVCPTDTYCDGPGTVSPTDCPEHMISDAASDELTDCQCNVGFYQNDTTHCFACNLDRTVCDQIGQRLPKSLPGYWVDAELSSRGIPTVLECLPRSACPGLMNLTDVENGVCGPTLGEKPAYRGMRCNKCADGYYRDSGFCKECSSNAELVFGLSLLALIILLLLCIELSQLENGFGALNVFVTYLQINASFRRFDFGWPSTIARWFKILSIFNLNMELMQPECTLGGWDYTTKFVVANLILPLWIILFLVYALVTSIYYRVKYSSSKGDDVHVIVKDALKRLFRKCIAGMLLSLSWGYFAMAEYALEYYHCAPLDGDQFLYSEPSMQCWKWKDPNALTKLFPLALFALVVYPIGMITVIGVALYRYRPTGPRPLIGALRRAIARGDDDMAIMSKNMDFRIMMGFLYKFYEFRYYNHEMVNLYKKVAVILCKIIFKNPLEQALVNMVVLVSAMINTYMTKPFESAFLDAMEQFSCTSNVLVLFAGYLFAVDIWDQEQYDILEIATLAFLVVSFVVLGIFLILEFVPWTKRFVIAVWDTCTRTQKNMKYVEQYEPVPESKAWFVFGAESEPRAALIKVLNHPRFDPTMMYIVIASTVVAVLNEVPGLGDTGYDILEIVDIVFVGVFVVEAVGKSIAMCFIGEKRAYLRDFFNWLDFLIVVVSVISIVGALGITWLRGLRLVRIFRSLRVVVRYLRVFRLFARIASQNGAEIMEKVRREESKEVQQILAQASQYFSRGFVEKLREYLAVASVEDADEVEKCKLVVRGLYTVIEDETYKPQGRIQLIIQSQHLPRVYEFLTFHASEAQRKVLWGFIHKAAQTVNSNEELVEAAMEGMSAKQKKQYLATFGQKSTHNVL